MGKKMVIIKRKSEIILSFKIIKVFKKGLLTCYQVSLNCGKVSKYGISNSVKTNDTEWVKED